MRILICIVYKEQCHGPSSRLWCASASRCGTASGRIWRACSSRSCSQPRRHGARHCGAPHPQRRANHGASLARDRCARRRNGCVMVCRAGAWRAGVIDRSAGCTPRSCGGSPSGRVPTGGCAGTARAVTRRYSTPRREALPVLVGLLVSRSGPPPGWNAALQRPGPPGRNRPPPWAIGPVPHPGPIAARPPPPPRPPARRPPGYASGGPAVGQRWASGGLGGRGVQVPPGPRGPGTPLDTPLRRPATPPTHRPDGDGRSRGAAPRSKPAAPRTSVGDRVARRYAATRSKRPRVRVTEGVGRSRRGSTRNIRRAAPAPAWRGA